MAGWGAYLVRNYYIFLTSSVFPGLSEIKGYVGLFVCLGNFGAYNGIIFPFPFLFTNPPCASPTWLSFKFMASFSSFVVIYENRYVCVFLNR